MKKSIVIVLAALVFAGANGWAQVVAFPVKIRGAVTFPQSETAVAKLAVTEADLVLTGDHVLLLVDFANHGVSLVEVDGNTNVVATLMSSERFAILPDGNFSAAMVIQTVLPTQPNPTPADGIINFSGKITPSLSSPKSVNATVAGVLNDSFTDNGAPDIIIKGKLSKSGKPFPFNPVN